MLPLYEGFRKYDVPSNLQGELFDSDNQALAELINLNKINIFVGPNNSGKSLLLREIVKTQSKTYYGDEKWAEIESCLKFFDSAIKRIRVSSGIHGLVRLIDVHAGAIIDLKSLSDFYTQLSKYVSNYEVSTAIDLITGSFLRTFEFNEGASYSYTDENNYNSPFNTYTQRELLRGIFTCLNELKAEAEMVTHRLAELALSHTIGKLQRIYIPTFRSLKEFNNSQIELSIRKDYTFPDYVRVYTGQDFAKAIENHKNDEHSYRKKIKAFESFLARTFFQNQTVVLTYHKNQNVLLIKIGDEKDRPIYQLGDGLQMIIILTFPFFMYSSGIISIEEPELFIHPGLQKEFINFLIKDPRVNNFQIYLSTHSNHILDSVNLSDKISIFSVSKRRKEQETLLDDEKVPDFIINNLAFGDRNMLSLLGVTSTSVYLSNCVIWVEGITDKIYLQNYISAYFESSKCQDKYSEFQYLKEGIHYSFSLTGGDSIIHWDFSENLDYNDSMSKIIVSKFCAKSFVIVDNDFGKNEERKKKLREVLDGRLLELKYPEIENMIPSDVLPIVLSEYLSVNRSIRTDQIEIVSDEELLQIRIGKLIDTKMLADCPNCKKFSSDTGSLKSADKYEFCHKAIKFIDGNNITDYACQVVETLLDFIIGMNSNYVQESD